ncbi:uncharacterized protein LOC106050380 [Biomphalaria glabrata]|uniref:Uncharacterized protein LOC106050380 n=2 Tax=Biomphalaria glabrata TaxID=6526 RepID=A0A2C9LTD5_BIOGL|nr:uncharacterized protein LOC106050380 [Biomphalaria glabrata]KAI8775840.1 tumor necrosis factor receptor superfamily member 26 [Biomphalaria glabrata]
MLTVPWFVTSTIQDLFRWSPRHRLQNEGASPGPVEEKPVEAKNISAVSVAAPPAPASNVAPVAEKAVLTPTKATPNFTAVKSKTEPPKPAKKETVSQSVTQPEVNSGTKTSYKTLVLAPSASGGKMSFEWAKEQVEKFKFDFDDADKDKSGSLSFSEVYQVLKKVGFNGSEQEAQVIFGHLDRDSDKKVTREEFEASLKNLPRLTIKEFCLRKAFLQLDKDKSGYLTREEIEDATKKSAGLDIAAEKIADLLIYLCKEDKDQKVSYEEFLRVFGVHQEATVMRQVFSKLDADKSGFLTKDEILAAVKSEFELKLKASKISDLLCYWCKDEDKKISYEEFVTVWTKQEAQK